MSQDNEVITKKTAISKSSRANIAFPVARISNMMREIYPGCQRQSGTASVFLAAALEYFMAELLEISINETRESKRQRITPKAIINALSNDEELDKLFKGAIILNGDLSTARKKANRRKIASNKKE